MRQLNIYLTPTVLYQREYALIILLFPSPKFVFSIGFSKKVFNEAIDILFWVFIRYPRERIMYLVECFVTPIVNTWFVTYATYNL